MLFLLCVASRYVANERLYSIVLKLYAIIVVGSSSWTSKTPLQSPISKRGLPPSRLRSGTIHGSSSGLYVPNSLDNCVLVPAGEGAEELWPNVLGTNATEVALGAWVGGPGQRGPIQDAESRGPDSLPTRVICSDGSGLHEHLAMMVLSSEQRKEDKLKELLAAMGATDVS